MARPGAPSPASSRTSSRSSTTLCDWWTTKAAISCSPPAAPGPPSRRHARGDLAVADRVMPGFGEQMRQISLRFVPTAILSRQVAVIRKGSAHHQPAGSAEVDQGDARRAQGPARQALGAGHIRRGALLHRSHRRPLHRDRDEVVQGVPPEIGDPAQNTVLRATRERTSANHRNPRRRPDRPQAASSGCTVWAPTATTSCRSWTNWICRRAGALRLSARADAAGDDQQRLRDARLVRRAFRPRRPEQTPDERGMRASQAAIEA
jgi:hypothetical protein